MELQLEWVKRIWDKANHSAFTDLINFRGVWFCTFRESDLHQDSKPGSIRVIWSKDLIVWQSAHEFCHPKFDLRDPKFSINPEGKLLLHMQGIEKGNWQPLISFSSDGLIWSSPIACFAPHEWPWRTTWHDKRAYTVSYRLSNLEDRTGPWLVSLWVGNDALHYEKLVDWNIAYYPSEATIRFKSDGDMVVLIRRREQTRDGPSWIGVSKPPYALWQWRSTSWDLEAPNFLILEDGAMCASGRLLTATPYGLSPKTAIANMTLEEIYPALILPSGGDCSYPGMVIEGNALYVSYYSSHETKTSIYLAKIEKNPQRA